MNDNRGWKMVPVEPTEAMISAGYSRVTTAIENDSRDIASVYHAMLAAAPEPPSHELTPGSGGKP